MNFRDRMFVNSKASSSKVFILMGISYGFIFGGIGQIESVVNGNFNLIQALISMALSAIGYLLMFLAIMLIVYNSQGVKVLLSIGIGRKNLIQCWRDLNLLFIGFSAVLAIGVNIYLSLRGDHNFSGRLLDIDINELSFLSNLKLFVTAMIFIVAAFGVLTLMVWIGNHFGWKELVSFIAVIVSGLIVAIPTISHMLVWGEHYYVIMLVLALVGGLSYWVSYRLVNTLEVKR